MTSAIEDSAHAEDILPEKHFPEDECKDEENNRSETTKQFLLHALRKTPLAMLSKSADHGLPTLSLFSIKLSKMLMGIRHGSRESIYHTKISHHINVNERITGIKDPHIPISANTAKAAGVVGKAMDFVNKAAPALMAVSLICDGYELGKNVVADVKNDSSRNTAKKVATTVTGAAGGSSGSAAGAAIGTIIFPGVGTLVGGLVGGIVGGAVVGMAGEFATEAIFDKMKYNIDEKTCEKCGKTFKHRRYQDGSTQKLCNECRDKIKRDSHKSS
uniref:Gly-zipper_Omp domain-containing protein n=1 Tax=Caenorhabditis tropicalis TaxID=1561998 RepID=A0A1I7UR80_9PELO